MGQDLADQEHVVPTAVDCLPDELFRGAVGIHLGGVDERHPELEPKTQSRDFTRA